MNEKLVSLIIQGVLAIVLIVAVTFIVLSPVPDEASKGALVILGSAVGFIFGRSTTFGAHSGE